MPNYQFTNKAVSDISQIWEYTFGNWSEKQADKYYKQIIRACQKIAANPSIGKKYNKFDFALFGLKVNRHIIFYRIIDSRNIEITRILHERMDLKNRLLEK